MRYLAAATVVLLLAILTLPARAFVIEQEIAFDAAGSEATIRIISTADLELFEPIIRSFQRANPKTSVHYQIAASTEIQKAITEEGELFDVVISSAMDLQTKLANDGYALQYSSDTTDTVPDWGKWRNSVFAFTQEPATIVLSLADFEGLEIPKTRSELINTIRAHPDRFKGRIGTYDIRTSGLGYLFATQDSRSSDTFWRLTELFGTTGTDLYCCSSDMIDDVQSGKLAIAYNVLGSYALARQDAADKILVIEPEDFTTVMLRSALVMRESQHIDAAQSFLDHLLTLAWNTPNNRNFLFRNIAKEELNRTARLRPIRLGPGLLVFLDDFKRRKFIDEWVNSILQRAR